MPEKIKLTRRRALAALGVIGAGSAAAGAGTFALFSDTESSGPNSITAGTLDLQLDPDGSGASTSITLSNIKPTDSGYIAIELGNSGNVNGNITSVNVGDVSGGTFTSSLVTDTEGTDPEAETETTTGGELDSLLETQIVLETSTDFSGQGGSEGVNQGSEYTPSGNETTVVADGTTLTNAVGTNTVTDSLGTTETKYLVINYNFPDGGASDNDAQGDVAEFDVQIELTQA